LQSLGIGTLPSTNETVYPDQQPGAVVPPAAGGFGKVGKKKGT
jgi:hypothetical protein